MRNLIILISIVLYSLALSAQDASLIVQTHIEGTFSNKDRKISFYVLDADNNEHQKIYQINEYDIHIPRNGISISLNNEYIAIIKSKKLSKEEWEETRKRYINSLVIIDGKGNTVNKIDKDVQKIAWHPDGEIIAYITGTYHEDGYPFSPTGVYYMNVITGQEIRVSAIKYPYKIHWLKKDKEDLLYIKELAKDKNPVYEFNINNQQIKLTNYEEVNFSPDGKYYIHYPEAEVGEFKFKVFETATNKEITDKLTIQVNPNKWVHFQWVFDEGHLFLYKEGANSKQNYIYDIESGKLLKRFTAQIYEGNIFTSPKAILLKQDDKLFIITKDETGIHEKKYSTMDMDK